MDHGSITRFPDTERTGRLHHSGPFPGGPGGRTTKLTDPDAPKEIELKDILSYDASFYLVTRTTFDDGNELTIWWSRY